VVSSWSLPRFSFRRARHDSAIVRDVLPPAPTLPAPHQKRKACWGSVSERAKDFILALLQVDPDARLTPKQALRHPWLAEEKTGGDGHDLAPSVVRQRWQAGVRDSWAKQASRCRHYLFRRASCAWIYPVSIAERRGCHRGGREPRRYENAQDSNSTVDKVRSCSVCAFKRWTRYPNLCFIGTSPPPPVLLRTS